MNPYMMIYDPYNNYYAIQIIGIQMFANFNTLNDKNLKSQIIVVKIIVN